MNSDPNNMTEAELLQHLRTLRAQVNNATFVLANKGYRVEVEIKHLTRCGNRHSYPDLDFVVLKQVK